MSPTRVSAMPIGVAAMLAWRARSSKPPITGSLRLRSEPSRSARRMVSTSSVSRPSCSSERRRLTFFSRFSVLPNSSR